jgi:hypothetical protein
MELPQNAFLPSDINIPPAVLGDCVGSVSNGTPFCINVPVKSILPVTATFFGIETVLPEEVKVLTCAIPEFN